MKPFDAKSINGVIPAMITSFNKDESINKEGIRKTVNYLISQKVNGLYITGSTGETFLMSPDEKKRVIEIIVEEVNRRVPVIAHIGSIGTKITTELGQFAEKAGVDALSALPPFYYNFSNDEIFSYYSDISNSSNLPIFVYNISHANLMDLDMLKRLASIENVKGVKYTASTHFAFSKIKKEIGESFKIYSGMDEMALSGIISGADGIIGSFFNLMPEMFVNIYQELQKGNINEAKKIQEKINIIILYALKKSGYPFIKMGLKWLGVDSGKVRRPFKNIVDTENEKIIMEELKTLSKENDLSGIKFLEIL
jgi:N-acetylneuraminate lyase